MRILWASWLQTVRRGTIILGYLGWFDSCQEKKATSPVEESSFGFGGNLVSSFTDGLQSQEQKDFYLCFYNFFTCVKLVSALKEKSIKATATIRECSTEKCPLVASNDMKKLPRELFDYKTDPDNGVIVCKWNDNCVASLCSNAVLTECGWSTTHFLPLLENGCGYSSHSW